MNKKGKMKLAFCHPEYLIGVLLRRTPLGRCISDHLFIKLDYFSGMRKFPNLINPKTFNEKLQWLKLHDIHPEYAQMVDKIESKKYVAKRIGEEFVIPTLGVWEKFDDIVFEDLPNKFVLKTSHDSGSIIVVGDKSKMDFVAAKKKLQRSLNRRFYNDHREYPYKDVSPRILAEKFMVDESGIELKDYKFFCFNGEPKFLKVDFNRFIDHHANYYSLEWDLLEFGEALMPPKPDQKMEKPRNFDKMIEIAKTLAQGIPFLRVDLYNINGQIYFGEMTFFPASGSGRITPGIWDNKIGELLQLPLKSGG